MIEPEVDPEDVREAIDAILRRPEFDEDDLTLFERALEAVSEVVGRLFDAAFTGGGSGALAWSIVALLTLAAVVFAVRFGRGVRRDPGGARPASGPRRSAPDWRAEAEDHERAGRWRAALRCRWRALVADLAARGLVEEVPGRTAGEYRRQVGASAPRAAADFDGATTLFESAWYGAASTGAEESERFRALAERVLMEAG